MLPNLIHPLPVTVRRRSNSSTLFDPVAREPVRQLWKAGQGPGLGTELELEAQVHFGDGFIKKPTLDPGAPREASKGYLLFRLVDLVAAGVATDNGDGTVEFGLARGDLIVRVGRRRTKLYILYFKDAAGYPDQDGCTLLEVDFGDRQPSSTPSGA